MSGKRFFSRAILVLLVSTLGTLAAPDPGGSLTASSGAPDIIVSTTSDEVDPYDGEVSLREAIIAANNTPGPQAIGFNIPADSCDLADFCDVGVCVIRPLTLLPPLVGDGTTIDATTQPDNLVVLHGGSVTPPSVPGDGRFYFNTGLEVYGSAIVIRGLVINGFVDTDRTEECGEGCGYGIFLGGQGNLVEGNLIGTDACGTVAVPNGVTGVIVEGANSVVRDNLLSGEIGGYGIEIFGCDDCDLSGGHRIQGNKIGTDLTGTSPVPNYGGISIEGNNNLIGGLGPGEANVIAYSYRSDGISVILYATGNTFSGNSIFANWDLGIDLGFIFNGDGVTPNDAEDADTGPNGLMNFPVLERTVVVAPGRLVVKGYIDTPNPEMALIEFFATEQPLGDPSGHGEGQTFLGTVRPNRQGKFTATLSPVTPGTRITATATDVFGNTSEFAANIEARRRRR